MSEEQTSQNKTTRLTEQQIVAILAKTEADDRLNHYLRSRNITWRQYPDVNGRPLIRWFLRNKT